MPVNLEPWLPHLPAWAMVLFRLTGIFAFAPVFGSRNVPVRIRVLWALGLSLCVYPILQPMLMQPGSASGRLLDAMTHGGLSLPSLAVAIALELGIGLILGMGASMPMMGMQLAGHMVDQQIGLGLAAVFNPELDDQSSVLGEFYFIMAMTVFLSLGGDRLLLSTLLDSFHRIPLAGFAVNGQVVALLVGLMGSMFDLAMRVAAPLLCLVFLETVAMGFIARTVPQMNLLSVGFPIRILMGIAVMIAAVQVHAESFVAMARHTLEALASVFGQG